MTEPLVSAVLWTVVGVMTLALAAFSGVHVTLAGPVWIQVLVIVFTVLSLTSLLHGLASTTGFRRIIPLAALGLWVLWSLALVSVSIRF